MFTIKEIPYTVESNAFVIMFYDQECDYSGVFDTREAAEFAMENQERNYAMSKLFQGYAVKTSEWIDMPRGTDLYEQAVKANAPIRILYESGKSYITQNQDKAI
mgnify:CR=1 FL=1